MADKFNNQFSVKDLTVFRSDLALFEPISFELNAGSAIQVGGTNGAGKTSLLRCLCGLSQRHRGVIDWNEHAIETNQDDFYRQLLYIGHSLGLKPKLTVEQNLSFYQQLRFKHQAEQITQALEALNIGLYHDELVGNLSAGQKRRVALARIMTEPVGLWILDEPMVALDADGQQWLENVCNSHLSRGGMIILTSHQIITGINDLQQCDLQEAGLDGNYMLDEAVE